MKRVRGLISLLGEAVEHGSKAVERIQLETAKRTFDVIEAVPGLTEPTKIVHAVHDVAVSTTHVAVRAVSGAVVKVAGAFVDPA